MWSGIGSEETLSRRDEWRTVSKALEKSKDMRIAWGLSLRMLVIEWSMDIMAAVIDPVGRKAC